jgi:hypothetical protein
MTPIDRACRELHAEYVRTRDLAGIAAANHVKQAWLLRRWRALGLPVGLTTAALEARSLAIAADRARGMSYKELMHKYNAANATIALALKRHGMTKPRNKSPHPRNPIAPARGHLAAAA